VAAKTVDLEGFLPVRYEEADSGRLYATGLSLQSCFRLVRRAAMAGQWDYDVSNAHYAILNQTAQKAGYDCHRIRDYLTRKKAIRAALAATAGVTVEQIKQVLIALIYGASTRRIGSIPDILGTQKAAAALYNDPLFMGIANDAKSAFNAILKAVPAGKRLRNALGSEIERAGRGEASLISHLLQGYEACALRAVVRMYGRQITLCVHDGWCSAERLDVPAMEAAILNDTGLQLAVEESMLAVPSLDEVIAAIRASRAGRIA
jgi:hypothetical protein